GIVTPGNIAVTSGTPISIAPQATTTYTLTVTNSVANAQMTTSVEVTPVPAAPSISSFAASPATIVAGGTANLTGVFANGTGVVTPGNIALTSGTSISIAPQATTTYNLTVADSAGTEVKESTLVIVTPAAAFTADLGVNIGWVSDWDPTQMFADAMRQARKFGSTAKP